MDTIENCELVLKYLEDIKDLDQLNLKETIFLVLGDGGFQKVIPPCHQSLTDFIVQGAYEQVAIQLVRSKLPDARFGFDYNPAVQPDKKGKDKKSAAWVRYGIVDVTCAHKYLAVALIMALVTVIREIEVRSKVEHA